MQEGLQQNRFLKHFAQSFYRMQTISLCWFAMQQETSILRQQKLFFLYLKYSLAFNKMNLNFKREGEVDKKWLNLRKYWKTHIYIFGKLKINRQVINSWTAPQECSFFIFRFFSYPNAKTATVEVFPEWSLVWLTLTACIDFRKFWKNASNVAVLVCCSSKLVHLHSKNLASFN